MMTPKQVVAEWAAAFNRHDADVVAALYHEDATNVQVALREPVQGPQAMLDSFTAFFRLGEFAGHAPTGSSFTLRGCGFFHVTDGKIRFQRGYWDKATWFKQLGQPID